MSSMLVSLHDLTSSNLSKPNHKRTTSHNISDVSHWPPHVLGHEVLDLLGFTNPPHPLPKVG